MRNRNPYRIAAAAGVSILSGLLSPVFAEPVDHPDPLLFSNEPLHTLNRDFSLRVELLGGLKLSGFSGYSLSAGYQAGPIALDLRYLGATTDFETIFSRPNPGDLSQVNGKGSVDEAGSELNRHRDPKSPWALRLFEPGVEISGRIFDDLFPRLSQKVRVGFAFGRFSDQVNALDFSPRLFSFETGLQHALGPGNRYALEACIGWRTGVIVSNAGVTGQQGRIPVNFMTLSLALSYLF